MNDRFWRLNREEHLCSCSLFVPTTYSAVRLQVSDQTGMPLVQEGDSTLCNTTAAEVWRGVSRMFINHHWTRKE